MLLLSVVFAVSFIFLVAFLMAFLASPGLAEKGTEDYTDLEDG